jgi:hypothetical protein
VASDAVFYAYYCGCGNAFTSKADFYKYMYTLECNRNHPWLRKTYEAFKLTIFGWSKDDVFQWQGLKVKLRDNIDGNFSQAWEENVLPEFKTDFKRLERFKLMWKYMNCMY